MYHATPTPSLDSLDELCSKICQTLDREHAVLRGTNGLIGRGVDDLEEIHSEKTDQIERLEGLSRSTVTTDEKRAYPVRAQAVREHIERCKQLQYRNHQVFSRIIAAQHRIISALRSGDDDISIYDRAGRTRDFGMTRLGDRA
jgi:flagellar biosynthesis/type III secretory pathway chaperone